MLWITVLYDPRCSFCLAAADWLRGQPKYVPMEFVAAGSHEAALRFPGLRSEEVARELTVVAEDRDVYSGTKAMLLCLWALRDYRGWALRLAEPDRIGSTTRYFAWFSRHRQSLPFLRWLLP